MAIAVRAHPLVLLLLLSVTGSMVAAEGTAPTSAVGAAAFHAERIAPLLTEHCLRCHGPAKQKGGLRVDSRAALLAGGEHGAAIVPGDADASLLMTAVRRLDADLAMPPSDDQRLDARQIADLAVWIAAGAPWSDQALVAVAAPEPAASATAAVAAPEPPPPPAERSTVGRLHPALVHFPIACLVLALVAELLRVVQGPRWEPAVRLLLAVGVLGAAGAVLTGTFFADQGSLFDRADTALLRHEVLGWLTLLLGATAWGLALAGERPRLRVLMRLVLLLAAGAALLSGKMGGEMVHGSLF